MASLVGAAKRCRCAHDPQIVERIRWMLRDDGVPMGLYTAMKLRTMGQKCQVKVRPALPQVSQTAELDVLLAGRSRWVADVREGPQYVAPQGALVGYRLVRYFRFLGLDADVCEKGLYCRGCPSHLNPVGEILHGFVPGMFADVPYFGSVLEYPHRVFLETFEWTLEYEGWESLPRRYHALSIEFEGRIQA